MRCFPILRSLAVVLLSAHWSLATEASQPAVSSPEPLRLLHIGNSFSGNATRYLPALAKAGGKPLEVYGCIIGGSSFKVHADHLRKAKANPEEGKAYKPTKILGAPLSEQKMISLPEALQAKPWDVVTIQQVSRESYLPETFEPYATEVIGEVRSTLPKATLYIHQTWAYRPDHALFVREPEMNPERMQALANAAYQQLAERHGIAHFLPSGLAVQRAAGTEEWKYQRDPDFDYAAPPEGALPKEKSLYAGASLKQPDKNGVRKLNLDAFHLGPAGCYLVGCVWYEVLFNDSALDLDFVPKELTPEEAASLRKIAHETVAAYREHGISGVPAAR